MSSLLIKNGDVYIPEYQEKKDILVINDKIFFIDQNILTSALNGIDKNMKIIDARKCIIVPGHIDQHVHINGAGGEGGPQYRTPPVPFSEFVKAGITSVIGVLGTDGFARSLKALLMKARALEQEGISTWIYTGAYSCPSPTITESILSDIILIDKVIGLKIALSDHRASHPTLDEFRRATSDARAAGVLAGKAGVVHIHMGSEKSGLSHLFDVIKNTEIPIEQFAPTHLNKKDEAFFQQVVTFGKMGGYIDFTIDSSDEDQSSKAIKRLLKNGIPIEKITLSTDGNGSLPKFNDKKEFVGMRIASVLSLHQEFINLVKEEKFSIKEAVCLTSTNIAKHLKLTEKGEITIGKDADILALDKESLKIKHVIARGKILMEDEEVIKFGTFEKK
ncbi:beta-aspartyl-peptidase [candidate division KSB1 bacterium]|nr:beta-aspartyl-peptidase [candidate division KSB1 bacterium]